MIRLKSLQLQGFRRFTEPTTIFFPEKGLLLLDGDSGAGKSTILQGIAYALDICPFPSTTLKSWSGEPLQVVLILDADGQEVTIHRGKKTSIQFGNEPVRTGAKALEEGLRTLFKMTPDLVSALTYKPQDTLGLFLSKDDGEKKEFLAQVLGLSGIEAALDESEVKRKTLQSELSFSQGILSEREGALRKALDGLTEVSPDPVDIGFEERVRAAQSAVNTLAQELASLEQAKAGALADWTAKNAELVQDKTQRLETAKSLYKTVQRECDSKNAELESSRNELRAQISRIGQELSFLTNKRQALAAAQGRLASLEKNECYVCHKPFAAEAAIDEEREIIENLSSEIAKEPILKKRFEELGTKLASLVPFVDERLAKFQKVISGLEFWLSNHAKNIVDPNVVAIEERLKATTSLSFKARDDLALAKSDLARFEQVKNMKALMRSRQDAIRADAVKKVDEIRAKVAETEAAVNAEKDFSHVLGKDGFLGAIFGEVLAEISEQANAVLGRLQNTANVSVVFRTETAKGKKSISPVFFVDGNEATRDSGLSGGMRSSADLAVDLGVITVLERRLGQAPGWLALDESFNGMPTSTKENALEILQQFAKDRLVLVVDHGSEMKAFFDKVLTVRLDGGRTVIE